LWASNFSGWDFKIKKGMMEKTLEVGILSVVNQTARILSRSLSFEEGAEEFLKDTILLLGCALQLHSPL
jgi:hypothetical protein